MSDIPGYTIVGPPGSRITFEPLGEPLRVEVYSDGTWLVNGEEWEGDEDE